MVWNGDTIPYMYMSIFYNLDKEIIREIALKATFESMKDDLAVNYFWSKIHNMDHHSFVKEK